MPKGIPLSGVNKGWFRHNDERHKKTESHKRKIGLSNSISLLGRKFSESHKENISKGLKKLSLLRGWKKWRNGNKNEYTKIHQWVRRRLGSPMICSKCGTKESKIYHWANLSGLYKKDSTDWIRLCPKCHRHMDRQ